MTERRVIRIDGIVQGVGFRPFVHRRATSLGLAGYVRNDPVGALVDVEGPETVIGELVRHIREAPPPTAHVAGIRAEPAPPAGYDGFRIDESSGHGQRSRFSLTGPDTATCDACLAEVLDPGDRRYRYPFLACTDCGPRYTIVRAVPYDRSRTSLATFPLCPPCAAEYEDPADRRFHAQPLACPECGPMLSYEEAVAAAPGAEASARSLAGEAALRAAVADLRAGRIVAIKGLGGYHMACDATNPEAVGELRRRKRRPAKPFAVMVADLDTAGELCRLGPAEQEALTSARRPIVLAPDNLPSALPEGVAPGLGRTGLLLPYTPLHHFLSADVGRPLVVTSGNASDDPIAYRDEDARRRLAGLVDGFLLHDRPIEARCDDSVVRVVGGSEMLLRRSRGYAPAPISAPGAGSRRALGVGAHLKNTFCLARGGLAFPSAHVGDLEGPGATGILRDEIRRFCALFGFEPEVVGHDLHPEYASTRVAEELGLPTVAVQHHHAHVAACMAEHAATGPVLGIAFDGTGLGEDGAIWGGEILMVDDGGFERLSHLAYVPLPGGDAAAREPWRMAAAHLWSALGGTPGEWPLDPVPPEHRTDWPLLGQMLERGVRSPPTSSVGRLFDAVAALAGVRSHALYEGQAAMELEDLADPAAPARYGLHVRDGDGGWTLDPRDLVVALAEDSARGLDASLLAGAFHRALAHAVAEVAALAREAHGLGRVALTGGVFQNALLTGLCADALEARGFDVLTHRAVPCNDGGISLGQAVVASRADVPARDTASAVPSLDRESAPCA